MLQKNPEGIAILSLIDTPPGELLSFSLFVSLLLQLLAPVLCVFIQEIFWPVSCNSMSGLLSSSKNATS